MAEKFLFKDKLNSFLAKAFLSPDMLELGLRRTFKEQLLSSTQNRLRMLLAVLLLVQFSNLIVTSISGYSETYAKSSLIGVFLMIFLCLFFLVLFEYFKRTKRTIAYWIHSLSVKACLATLLLATLFFIYGDIHENQSLTNYMILVMAIGIIPDLSWRELVCYLLPVTSFSVIVGVDAAVSSHTIAQMIMLPIISLYSAQLRLSNSIRDFREKQALNDANAELERLSETDPLTKLLNRRGMEKQIRQLTNSHRRSGESICMLMLDIDYFKQYNDKYLHTEGDKCLAKVGECLKNNAKRSTDIVARYGGEEFVVVVRDMKHSELIAFSLMIKSAVEELKIDFIEKWPYVTVSVGVALMEMKGSNPSDELFITQMIERSDKELYNAKGSGRNCVSYNGNIYT